MAPEPKSTNTAPRSEKFLFKDLEAWKEFEKKVLGGIFEKLKPGENIRIWVPECRTGEDAISAAILLIEAQKANPARGFAFQVFGTDPDGLLLKQARKGIFPKTIDKVMAAERRDKHFIDRGENYLLRPEILKSVRFSRQNLFIDPPFLDVDVIIFRDSLSKINPEEQVEAVNRFAFSLNTGGFLFIAIGEQIPQNLFFKNISDDFCVFSYIGGEKKKVSVPRNISTKLKDAITGNLVESLENTIQSKDSEIQFVKDENDNLRHDINAANEKILTFWEIFQSFKGDSKNETQSKTETQTKPELQNLQNVQSSQSSQNDSEIAFLRSEIEARDLQIRDLESRKTEVELSPSDKAKVEALAAEFTSILLNIKQEQLEAGVLKILKDIGTATRADRGYVFQFHQFEPLMDCTMEWYSPGTPPEITNLKRVSPNKILWSVNKLKKYENVVVNKISALPADAALDKADFEKREAKSYFLVPMICDSRLAGFCGFESVAAEVEWKNDTVQLMRHLAPLIVGALLRKKAELSLQSTEKMIKQIIEFLPNQLFVKTGKGETLFANKTFFDSNRMRDDFDDKRGFTLLPWKSQPFFEFRTGTGDITKNVTPKQMPEKIITDPLGRKKVFQTSVAPISVAGADSPCLLGYNEDVTLLKALEEKSKRVDTLPKAGAAASPKGPVVVQSDQKSSHSTSEVSGDFLEKIGSEIKIPIEKINGLAENFGTGALSKEQTDWIGTIRKSSSEAMMYLNNLVDFSSIMSGKSGFPEESFDIREVAEELSDMFAHETYQRDVDFITLIEKDVPVSIKTDRNYIRQILYNLVKNAVKFTSKGEIRIEISLDTMDTTKKTLRCEIVDTGSGIDASLTEKIFSGMPWIGQQKSMVPEDGGLGILVSRRLVDLLGGQIAIESQTGSGTNVWFTLQFKVDAAEELDLSKKARHFKEKKALIIDHNEKRGQALRHLLQVWKCRAEYVSNGFVALPKMREAVGNADPFQIVFLEGTLPGVGVDAVARKIRDDALIKDFPEPVLIKTVNPNKEENLENLDKIGFSTYLKKPVTITNLFDCLSAIFYLKKKSKTVNIKTALSLIDQKVFSKRFRILLAEDEAILQTVEKNLLRDFDYSIDVVLNGHEAVNSLSTQIYDIVLMDSDMPKMDGYSAAKAIRSPASNIKNKNVIIIGLTPDDSPDTKRKVQDSGMNGFVKKPVDVALLMEAIDEAFLKTVTKPLAKEIPTKSGIFEAVKLHVQAATPSASSEVAATSASSAPTAVPESAPVLFDKNALLKRLGNDENALKEIIKMFLKIGGIQINVLREAIRKSDAKMAERTASILIGASNNAEAVSIKTYSLQIEKAVKAENFPLAAELMEKLLEEFDSFKSLSIF
ncbi:MAG: response regulator [Candidatus Riflebacteria bacterium]|nr:response regulator [Candidatus Riflebacteria bacterium]